MRCWQKFPGSTLAAKWFWATRNWQVTEDRWQKTWFTCHSKNQHKQCKRIELRRWQSLRGSTLAFRSTWSSKKTSKFVKLLALIVNMLIQITCIVQIKPFLLHLKGKLYYGRPLTGLTGLEATPATVGLFPPDTQGPKKIHIMLMHANDLNMGKTVDACQWLQHGQVTDDKWQVTGDFKNADARLWIVLQYLASRSSFNDINELQTSRASTSASSSSFKLPGALSMKRMKWMSIVSSRTCHSCHHVTIMWAPCDLHVITPCLQWLLMGLCFGSSLKNYEGQLKNHTWKSWSQMKSLKSWSEIWTR